MFSVIQELPLPNELCSKIFCYVCKTPHTGLAVEVLKNILNVKHLNIPEKDKDVIIFNSDNIINYPQYKYIDINFYTCFTNLTKIKINQTDIFGDIVGLISLPKLNTINLSETCVSGDIVHLKSLPNLSTIDLFNTSVRGDIVHMKSLWNLTVINLQNTNITGNIVHLKSLLNLTDI